MSSTSFTVIAMTTDPETRRRKLAEIRDAMATAKELQQRAKDVRRDAVQSAMDAGVTAQEIAEFLDVNRSYVYQMRQGK